MKKKLIPVIFLFFLFPIVLSTHSASETARAPQSSEKQKFDYMSSILSRNTKPLGLKENVSLRKFLNQPSIKWAMRSRDRHLLN
jgi:hypothetical protein